jgi:cytochrome c biogenesis protein CcdA
MLLKKLITIFFTALFFLTTAIGVFAKESSGIYLFYGTGCPHCATVENYFEQENLLNKYPVEKLEIYSNKNNAILYNSLLDELGIPLNERGVPLVVIGNKIIVGDRPIIKNFVIEADKFLQISQKPTETPEKPLPSQKPDLTLAAVIGASIVDAINPCAFAVLIILMTAILLAGNRKKALKAGLAFASSIFISYFLMGLGLYKALGIGGISGVFYKTVGWLALILGLLNIKDYFWYGKGFLMEVPTAWRPKLQSLIKSATSPLGAFGTGFLVSLILLPCTSGPYIVILGMLAQKTLQTKAVLYLVLYNLIFISPMVLISLAVYKGFNPKKAEEIRQKQLKTLHLIAGIIMVIMGVVILKGWA